MPRCFVLKKVVSGGQTGVDQAALDVALDHGIACGGWLPKGRRTEAGPLDPRYPLREAASPSYAERTRLNVRDADATLILTRGRPLGGTALTVICARSMRQPFLVVDLDGDGNADHVRRWLAGHWVRILNVAGPRESKSPGIYDQAKAFLAAVFASP